MRTPLYTAAKEGSYETAVVLVSNYANRLCSDIDDKTPLSVSQNYGDQRMIMLLSDIANSPTSIPSPNYPSSHGSISPQPVVYPDIRPKVHPMNGTRIDHPGSGPVKPSRRKRKSTSKDKKAPTSRDQYSCEHNLMIASMPPMNNVGDARMNLLNGDMALKFWGPENCLKDMPTSWDTQQAPQSQQPQQQHHQQQQQPQQHFTQTMPPTSMVSNSYDFIPDNSYPSPFDTPPSVMSELSPYSIPNIMELSPLTPPPSWTTSPESDYSDSVNNC